MLRHILLKHSCMQQSDLLDLLVDAHEKRFALLFSVLSERFFSVPLKYFQ